MTISASEIQKLRQQTSCGMMDCKKALEEAKGDFDKAVENLRKKGQEIALKKAGREVKEGVIGSYIHTNQKVGVMVEVLCETDFVAKNKEFQELAKDIAMHIAANDSQYLKPEDIPKKVIEKEKEIYLEQVKSEDKPDNVKEKIVEGKIKKFKEEVSLLTQPFFKDPKMTISELLTAKIAKIGENIQIGEFIRYSLQ
ncbi:translation elongation factor Ts [Patescibacteria group bacterium]